RRHTRWPRDWSSDVCSSDLTEGPAEGPNGIATLRFDSREALDAAFGDPALKSDLMRTRDQFARAVQVMVVDENVVVPAVRTGARSEERRVGKEGRGWLVRSD